MQAAIQRILNIIWWILTKDWCVQWQNSNRCEGMFKPVQFRMLRKSSIKSQKTKRNKHTNLKLKFYLMIKRALWLQDLLQTFTISIDALIRKLKKSNLIIMIYIFHYLQQRCDLNLTYWNMSERPIPLHFKILRFLLSWKFKRLSTGLA